MSEEQPQPTFKLFTWKDVVSNQSPEDARQWFKENYPTASGHSLYKATYKYPEDLRPLLFMNENLNVGYLQEGSIDPGMRKLAFGSCIIHGPSESAKFILTQCWLFSSDELPPLFLESNVYPNFDFKKLDFNDSSDQAFVLDMFSKGVGDTVEGLDGTILSKETYK